MTSIEATCPSCGPVVCAPGDFDVRVWKGTGIYYVFTCPSCSSIVQKQADMRALNILLGEGLRPTIIRGPDESRHPSLTTSARPEGPPLTHDDLLDLHMMLQQPDWFDDLQDAG